MELQQVHQERWGGETCGRRKRTYSEEAAQEFAIDEHTNGPNDCSSPEAALKAARARHRAVPQQWQPQLHLRMRIRPRRTSVGNAHLERLPVPTDPESPLKGHEQWSKARTRPSVWTNLLMHARRSLPFLGGDGLEGPLPPTPKSAVYNGRQIHQLGSSLLGFIPTAWDALQSNCWRKIQVASAARLASAEMPSDGGSGESSTSATLVSAPGGGRPSVVEAGTPQDRLEPAVHHVKMSTLLSAHISHGGEANIDKWRSRRVTFDASDLTALLLQCFRRRLTWVALLLVSSLISLLLLYYSLTALLYLLTEAIAEHSHHFVTLGSPPWKSRSQLSVAERQLASGTSAQLHEDLQNLRQEVQKELKDMQDYMEQLHQQLNGATAVPERIRDEVCQNDGQVLNLVEEKVKLQDRAEAPDLIKDHRDAGEGWSESLSALKAQVKDLRRSDARIAADLEGLRKRFEEASANRGASATLEEIKVETQRMLQEYHSILNEEERIDWALESLGASIVVSETVSSLAHSTVSWGSKISSYLEELVEHDHQAGVAGGASRVVKKPNIVLQPDTHPGNCYPFYGEKGNVTILLPTAIFVTSVAVDGVSSKHFTASTPRKFTLWGYEDPRSTPALQETFLHSNDPSKPDRGNQKCRGMSKPCNTANAKVEPTQQLANPTGESWWESARRVLHWMVLMLKSPARVRPEWDSRLSARQFRKVHLGDFELRKPQKLSVFDLQKKHEAPVRKVTFEFLSNFGHPYTCIYRLRVHGDRRKMSTLPLPVVEKE